MVAVGKECKQGMQCNFELLSRPQKKKEEWENPARMLMHSVCLVHTHVYSCRWQT